MPMTPTGWHPRLLPLYLDYEADLLAGADASAIAAWNNLGPVTSATANLAQSSGGAKPTLKRNISNGHSVARFDGTTDFMTLSYQRPEGACTYAIAFTCKRAFASVSVDQIFELTGASTADVFMLVNSAGYQPYSWKCKSPGAALMVGIADTPDTSPHVLVFSFDGSSASLVTSYAAMLDGVSKTVATSLGAGRGAGDPACINSFNAGGGSFAQVDIARLMYFGAQLTVPQMAAVSKYLTNLYGP